MTLRLHLHGNRHATIISAYAPTLVSYEEEKQRFYDNLRDVLQAVPKGDKIVLTGDFNARVGRLADLGQLRKTWGWEYEWERSSTAATLHGVQPFYFQHSVLPQRGSYNNVDAPQISTVASS